MDLLYLKHGLLLCLAFQLTIMGESRPSNDMEGLLNELIRYKLLRADSSYENNWSNNQDDDAVQNEVETADNAQKRSNTFYSSMGCSQPSVRSLHAQLRQVDTFNDMYLARSAEEAALFPNLNWDSRKRDDYMYILRRLRSKVLAIAKRDMRLITFFKRYLENKLGLPHYEVFPNNAVPGDDNTKRSNNDRCQMKGTTDNQTNAAFLCTACEQATILPDNMYPRYINDIVCLDTDRNCLKGDGYCKLKQFKVSILKRSSNCKLFTENGVQKYLQEWVVDVMEIGTGCECQMKPGAFFEFLKNG